ncbi:hypothetical protein [Shewanella algae]|uniref:hypothetical protein n=1 Tax=Shewanella algae TaxID=38313 RepID=UPI003006BCA0
MTAAKWILHSPKQAGAPQLQLLTPLDDGRQQLLWQYELPQAEDEVVLSAFYSDSEFVVATRSGQIYAGDIETGPRLMVNLPNVGIYGHGWLDKDRGEFWYVAEQPRGDDEYPCLLGWSLADWRPIKDIWLPEYLDDRRLGSTMVRRRDGCFLFYERECDSLAQREHGFWCTNVVDGQSQFHRIEGKPLLKARRYPSIHLCPERQLALLPVSECLLDESGDSPRIGLQLQLVALESLDVLWQQPVFWFDSHDGLLDPDDFSTLLESLRSGEDACDEEELTDALESLSDGLSGIRLCRDEAAFWLRLRSGELIKGYLAPEEHFRLKALSPRYRANECPLPGDEANPFALVAFDHYDYQLTSPTANRLLLVGFEIYALDTSTVTPMLPGDADCQSLPCYFWPKPELVMSEQQSLAHGEAGLNIVEADYLELGECLLASAKEMVSRLADLPNSAKGERLEWRFNDRNGSEWTEAQFVAALIVVPGGAELLAEAVEKLLAYPDAASLRSGADKPALSDTVLALAGDDIAYLPLLARYFNMLADGPGAAFHQQHSVPLIQRRHGQGLLKSRQYRRFVQDLPWPISPA